MSTCRDDIRIKKYHTLTRNVREIFHVSVKTVVKKRAKTSSNHQTFRYFIEVEVDEKENGTS